jgi:phenylalanine-4-hydroxylase
MSAIRPFKHFSPAEDRIWNLLWSRQIDNCRSRASKLWLEGLDKLGMTADRVPDFNVMNERLKELVGWELVSTDVVFSDGQTWFEHLARRQFLITEYIREEKDLLYTPLPDIWHDTFGHLPFMTNQRYADYIQHFAHVALGHRGHASLGSMWWYTIEFGFMMEEGQMKSFGAGLMSSPGEMEHAYSDEVIKTPFSLEAFERVSPSPHAMHKTLFILDNMEQLESSADMWINHHNLVMG